MITHICNWLSLEQGIKLCNKNICVFNNCCKEFNAVKDVLLIDWLISAIFRPYNGGRVIELVLLVRWSTIELSRPTTIHGPFRPSYHIPPLWSFCPLRNTQQTNIHPVRTYWFHKLCLIKDGHSTKCNRKRKET